MPRRSSAETKPGNPFYSTWSIGKHHGSSWYVWCAYHPDSRDCQEIKQLATGQQATTWQQAEAVARDAGTDGWGKRYGLWYCPQHYEERKKRGL